MVGGAIGTDAAASSAGWWRAWRRGMRGAPRPATDGCSHVSLGQTSRGEGHSRNRRRHAGLRMPGRLARVQCTAFQTRMPRPPQRRVLGRGPWRSRARPGEFSPCEERPARLRLRRLRDPHRWPIGAMDARARWPRASRGGRHADGPGRSASCRSGWVMVSQCDGTSDLPGTRTGPSRVQQGRRSQLRCLVRRHGLLLAGCEHGPLFWLHHGRLRMVRGVRSSVPCALQGGRGMCVHSRGRHGVLRRVT